MDLMECKCLEALLPIAPIHAGARRQDTRLFQFMIAVNLTKSMQNTTAKEEMMNYPLQTWVLKMPRAVCPECNRVFDLMDEIDSEEWSFGHDCEVEE